MRYFLIILTGLLLAACTTNRPAAEFNYLLTTERPANAARAAIAGPVYVAPLGVDEPYGQRGFIYREADQRFAVDPYRGYLAPPARLIDNRLGEWLSATGIPLTQDRNAARSIIDGRIGALYVDLRAHTANEAVLELRLTVRTAGQAPRQIIARGRAPVTPMSGDGIAAAMNSALADALSQLEAALAKESQPALR
ncbi:hypothetical protein JHS3_01870 [Jeongeupia sp. HS-3]|uniref:ABC-type transport auxiliary lipoprotein family protein n=1 Tax=Jeongeupia sp. HS-3 TaxID=1009682 RepID=UPI0018A52FE1|nr:ABC-type transport auxiliary lipoprotein family protein [Jeongeupia sp. HS-3]BCL74451.1 hypothetical protein JHS3_01870 [Jeongeupia sp. HS-3]